MAQPDFKKWPDMEPPFKVHIPEISNGFIDVTDAQGRSLCTCYTKAATNATAIAAALNFAFPKNKEFVDEHAEEE